ncbi:MAG: LuxR C-terminal-related transcriptional regulator [Treponema sp.]|nr:LuxR C-terminal-related transcriptional regulator [Treponema sp.]
MSERRRRGREILSRLQKGEKYERIARELGISVSTVKRRVKELFRALRVSVLAEFLK